VPKYTSQLKTGFSTGAKKGWHNFVWICKIVVPLTLVMTLLQWTGWLSKLDFLLNPLMVLLDLPPQAALPIITGMVINLYPVVAMITVIPFTVEQMTLIAVFNLIAHNLIMEGIVQHRSGFNFFIATLSRIAAATVTILIISRFMGDTGRSVAIPLSMTSSTPVLEVLRAWAISTVLLLLRVFGIVMFIMILQECLITMGWLDTLQKFLRHFMSIMGLSRKSALIWLAGNIFGLFYGGAVITEEAGKGTLTREELDCLHISIGINHSMLEDPSLFAVLGLHPFWLWIPRLVMAFIAVHSYRLVRLIVNRIQRKK